MNRYLKNICNLLFGATISSVGMYVKYRSHGIDLPWFLYAGIVSFAGLILTYGMMVLKKERKA